VEFSLTDEEFERLGRTGVPYRLNLEMEAGYTDFAVGIRDEIGAQISYFRQGIRVGTGA